MQKALKGPFVELWGKNCGGMKDFERKSNMYCFFDYKLVQQESYL